MVIKNDDVQFARKDEQGTQVGTLGVGQALTEQDQQKVKVKPLRSYHDSEAGKYVTPADDAYEVSRHRAAQLRANGLVEFENDGDEKDVVEAHVKKHMDASAARAHQPGIAERDKATPLRNPKLNYAEPEADQGGKGKRT